MKYIFPFEEIFYIYKITNDLNNKIYIGRTKVPEYRRRQHLSSTLDPAKIHLMQKIHVAIKKIGHEHFIFDVFEKCNNYGESCERENFWIKFYSSDEDEFGYNDKCGPIDAPIWSQEDRQKMSLRMSGQNNPMFGKTRSPEILKKLSEQFSGSGNPFYGKTHSEETKALIGQSSKGRGSGENNNHAKLNIDIVLKIREEWGIGQYTKVALSKKYNVSAATIGNIISGKTWRPN